MKHYLFLCVTILFCMCSCSTHTEDEPNQNPSTPNQPSQDPIEELSDWSVCYHESSWQNPQWVFNENTSEECLAWKAKNEKNLISHGSLAENNEWWDWWVNYPQTTEDVVIKNVVEFIKWTLDRPSDAGPFTKIGIDIFTATVYNATNEYCADYYYNQLEDNGPQDKWVIVFTENRYVELGETLELPSEYEEWVSSNKTHLTKNETYENLQIYSWTFEMSKFTDTYLKEEILPFIFWSRNPPLGCDSPYDTFSVSVTQVGTGIRTTYKDNRDPQKISELLSARN